MGTGGAGTMDILFVLAALCPALLVTRYEAGGKELSWQAWVGKAAGWFYTVTFVNFLLLHLDGWGSFDFSVISVQFLIRYMCSSAVIIFLAKLGKWAVKHTLEGGRDV